MHLFVYAHSGRSLRDSVYYAPRVNGVPDTGIETLPFDETFGVALIRFTLLRIGDVFG